MSVTALECVPIRRPSLSPSPSRNICIGIEKILESVCRKLLAEPGAVIHLFIAVVKKVAPYMRPSSFLTEHHIYAAQGQYGHESVTVATATVLGKGDIIRNLRLPFLRHESRAL